MNPRLRRLVQEIKSFQPNPPDDDNGDEIVMDSSLLLQLALVRQGLLDDFSEDDLYRALEELGVPEDDQASWFESMAAWV